MRSRKLKIDYELPKDSEILDRYLRKNGKGNKASMRRIRRELRKLHIIA